MSIADLFQILFVTGLVLTICAFFAGLQAKGR